MGEALNRAQEALNDAQSGDDLVNDPMTSPLGWPGEPPLDSPLDRETLDEGASSQLGGYDSPRRGANQEGQ